MSLTGSTTVPRYAQRRGTRGFAAFVTLLAGFGILMALYSRRKLIGS